MSKIYQIRFTDCVWNCLKFEHKDDGICFEDFHNAKNKLKEIYSELMNKLHPSKYGFDEATSFEMWEDAISMNFIHVSIDVIDVIPKHEYKYGISVKFKDGHSESTETDDPDEVIDILREMHNFSCEVMSSCFRRGNEILWDY